MSPLRLEPTEYPGWYRVHIYGHETRPVYIPPNYVQRESGGVWVAYGLTVAILVLALWVTW